MGYQPPDVAICRTLAIVSHGVDGRQGTKAVPSYIAAEAETAPLPKIVVNEPPPSAPAPPKQSLATRLGDLPMRVIYRIGAAALAMIVAVTAGVVYLVTRDGGGSSIAAAPATTAPPAGASPSSSAAPGVAASAGSAPTATSAPTAEPAAMPTAEATSGPTASAEAGAPTAAPATVEPASAGSGSPAATATPSPALKPLDAALADPRIPGMPKTKKLGKLPGRSIKIRRWLKDRRSRIAVPRPATRWRLAKPAPFATRQLLPAAKGARHRALLVSCPVPILVQDRLRDTAVIAARWTLNHQPKGAKIKWVASQPRKVGKRDAWLLAYEVRYTVKGKARSSMAAVLLTEVPKRKPAMLFVSIPDAQKKYWRDINSIMSAVRTA